MLRRAVALVSIVVGVAMLAPGLAGAAPRAFAPQFSTNDTGDITMAANTLMTCPDTDSLCPSARAGTLTGAADNNNSYVMRYVNTDPAAPVGVFDSSGADLTLPAGALVLRAFLYFGADSTAGVGARLRRTQRCATP